MDANDSSSITYNSNTAQAFSATCGGHQTYAYGEYDIGGTATSDVYSANTGRTVVGSNDLVGYAASPPSAYYTNESGFSWGVSNN